MSFEKEIVYKVENQSLNHNKYELETWLLVFHTKISLKALHAHLEMHIHFINSLQKIYIKYNTPLR